MLLLDAATGGRHQDPKYFKDNEWPRIVAGLLAAVSIYLLGLYLNRSPGKRYLDMETYEEVEFRPRHTLFFINMEYWGPIVAIITLGSIFVQKIKGG